MSTEHRNTYDDDLDLLALRYVTGELDDTEVDAFESRLAEDQEAREAVSRAVLVGSAVVTQPEPVVLASTGRPVSRSRRLAAAAAAVLILAIGIGFYLNRDQGDGSNGPEDAIDAWAQDLIASWVDFGDLGDLANGAAGEGGDADLMGTVFGQTEEGTEVTLDIGTEAPSWMVQALLK